MRERERERGREREGGRERERERGWYVLENKDGKSVLSMI